MPKLVDNKTRWDGEYHWRDQGDEWSALWGDPSMQWYGTILPRIKSHVPANRILEIACGYGRWTQYLKDLCQNLIAIDLSAECIQASKQRFADCEHIEFQVNDGRSLDMVADSSVDFIFSFDSLVHADASVMQAYLGQFKRILSADGVAFIHHSNFGEYAPAYSKIRDVPNLEELLIQSNILEQSTHWRDTSVDAQKIAMFATEAGLECISQEIVPWSTKNLFIDCMSTIVKNDSSLARNNRILRNANFMAEANNLLQLAQLYGSGQKPGVK
jgi:ubiquinone/menaquinone biosynthesis C-methylase UbiE